MGRTLVLAALAAFAATFAEGAATVTHREATNIVTSVAYTKEEADGRYLTTNLVGRTVVTGANTFLKMGAGTQVSGTDDMYIQLGGGELILPDNLEITVWGDRTLATWGITDGCTRAELDAALTPEAVLRRIKAMNDTQKAELRESLGIQ